MMSLAPVVLFVFMRPEHTRRTLEALAANELAIQTQLIVYSDAARTSDEVGLVQAVRAIVRETQGFASVSLIERETNLGLAGSIIDGVTQTCLTYGRVIVLEDDMITSPHFLRYMNDALDFYANEERVISIHGYVYPIRDALPETFFLKGADCWGWGTWQRGWALFEPDAVKLLAELRRRRLCRDFDFEGAYPYTAMLQSRIAGKNNSWAILWYASAFLKEKFTLYPGRSLVRNIGNDNSGTHCEATDYYSTELSATPVSIAEQAIRQDEVVRQKISAFLRGNAASLFGTIKKRSQLLLRHFFV